MGGFAGASAERGHDADQPDRSWWFTVGGGIDLFQRQGEPFRFVVSASARDLDEIVTTRLAAGERFALLNLG